MRNIHIDGATYLYKVGKQNTVVKLPNGKKMVMGNWDVKDVDPETFMRGQWKKTSDGAVTPSDIERYLRRQLSLPKVLLCPEHQSGMTFNSITGRCHCSVTTCSYSIDEGDMPAMPLYVKENRG
jgi:hypothetical protein